MLIYATISDLTALDPVTGMQWMSAAPSNAAALIRNASLKVSDSTQCDLYNVYPVPQGYPIPTSAPCGTAVGMPRDVPIAQAFHDAVCQQVLFWASNGVDPDAGVHGQAALVSANSSDGDQATYDTTRSPQWLEDAVNNLCPDSQRILQDAGLMSGKAFIW